MFPGSWLAVSAVLLAPQPAPGACALPGLDQSPRIPGVPFEELQQRADTAWDAARLPEALRFYRAGVELNPRGVDGHWRLGLLFFPDHTEAQAQLAFEILTRGDPADSLAPARVAVGLAPDWFAGHLALGRALLATGATEEALIALESAARLGPEIVEIYVPLAQAYQEAGRTGDVERVRQKLTELYSQREGAE